VREPDVLGSTDTEYAEDSPGYVDLWPASCGVRLEAAIWRRSILSGASSEPAFTAAVIDIIATTTVIVSPSHLTPHYLSAVNTDWQEKR
jgi:hypothetical protein